MSDEPDEGERAATIIRLFPDPDEHDADQPVARDPGGSRCSHGKHSRLDVAARRVYCSDCGAEVDAFSVLLRIAGDLEHLTRWRKEAERRARDARERLDEILRLEQNARGRLKRLDPGQERAAPQVPWGQGRQSQF